MRAASVSILVTVAATCVLFALAHLSCAQSPAGGPNSNATAHITGTICDRRTEGLAVVDAYVYVVPSVGSREGGADLRQDIVAEGRTSASGEYDLTGLPPGTYTVSIEPPEGSDLNGGSFTITVSEGAAASQSLRLGAGDRGTCFPETGES